MQIYSFFLSLLLSLFLISCDSNTKVISKYTDDYLGDSITSVESSNGGISYNGYFIDVDYNTTSNGLAMGLSDVKIVKKVKTSIYDKDEESNTSYKTWGNTDRLGSIGDIYIYNNPYSKKTEFFWLIGLGKDLRYWYFPTNGKNNKYWAFLGNTYEEAISRMEYYKKFKTWNKAIPGVKDDVYIYFNPYNGDTEFYRVNRDGIYGYFPTDVSLAFLAKLKKHSSAEGSYSKVNNKDWTYLGVKPSLTEEQKEANKEILRVWNTEKRLVGDDFDNNGIRDDVDIYLENKYGAKSKYKDKSDVIRAMTIDVKGESKKLEISMAKGGVDYEPSFEEARDLGRNIDRTIQCLDLLNKMNMGIPDDRNEQINALHANSAAVFNTKERLKVYRKWDIALGGGIISLPEYKNPCNNTEVRTER